MRNVVVSALESKLEVRVYLPAAVLLDADRILL
jgi:hypothetical protein